MQSGADIAIASRYVKGGGCQGWSLTRRVSSKGAIMLAHLLLPLTRKVHDPMSGYFMFRRQSIDMARLKPTGFKILLEMLVAGGAKQTAEVPYVFDVRSHGESKLSSKTQVDYLKHLWSLFVRTGELLRFLKFIFVGLTGVGVNLGLLWLLAEKGKVADWLSSGVAIEVSIIWNFILNNAFTFRDRNIPGIGPFIKRLLKFNAVSLPGWAINFGVSLFFRDVVHLDKILAQALGIIPATLWNYILNMVWTWR
jgi:dolichol-phosphate mannosyltransferase